MNVVPSLLCCELVSHEQPSIWCRVAWHIQAMDLPEVLWDKLGSDLAASRATLRRLRLGDSGTVLALLQAGVA